LPKDSESRWDKLNKAAVLECRRNPGKPEFMSRLSLIQQVAASSMRAVLNSYYL
jgi:hypothetical protein